MKSKRVSSRNRGRARVLRSVAVGAFVFFLLGVVADSAFARGGFRGGGFRSSSFRSFGSSGRRFGSGSLFGWGRSTRRAAPAAAPFREGGAVAGSRSSVGAQRNLYSAARQNGTLFSTRAEATRSFRSRYAGQYTSRFATRPAARPSYIPRTTVVNGRTVNVVYNAGFGGYGYMDPLLGRWVMYSALTDAAMLGVLMSGQGYYWGAPPIYVTHGPGFFTWAIILFIAFMVISSLFRMLRGMGRGRDW